MEVNTLTFFLGKTLESIAVHKPYADQVTFKTTDGETFLMYHEQGCCEGVELVDTVGDPDDLIGSPITMAEEVTSNENPPEIPEDRWGTDSFTWTFYKFATVKGYVTLRWLGQSNGYYSESVTVEQVSDSRVQGE